MCVFSASCLSVPLVESSERSTHLLTHKCKDWGFLVPCKQFQLETI